MMCPYYDDSRLFDNPNDWDNFNRKLIKKDLSHFEYDSHPGYYHRYTGASSGQDFYHPYQPFEMHGNHSSIWRTKKYPKYAGYEFLNGPSGRYRYGMQLPQSQLSHWDRKRRLTRFKRSVAKSDEQEIHTDRYSVDSLFDEDDDKEAQKENFKKEGVVDGQNSKNSNLGCAHTFQGEGAIIPDTNDTSSTSKSHISASNSLNTLFDNSHLSNTSTQHKTDIFKLSKLLLPNSTAASQENSLNTSTPINLMQKDNTSYNEESYYVSDTTRKSPPLEVATESGFLSILKSFMPSFMLPKAHNSVPSIDHNTGDGIDTKSLTTEFILSIQGVLSVSSERAVSSDGTTNVTNPELDTKTDSTSNSCTTEFTLTSDSDSRKSTRYSFLESIGNIFDDDVEDISQRNDSTDEGTDSEFDFTSTITGTLSEDEEEYSTALITTEPPDLISCQHEWYGSTESNSDDFDDFTERFYVETNVEQPAATEIITRQTERGIKEASLWVTKMAQLPPPIPGIVPKSYSQARIESSTTMPFPNILHLPHCLEVEPRMPTFRNPSHKHNPHRYEIGVLEQLDGITVEPFFYSRVVSTLPFSDWTNPQTGYDLNWDPFDKKVCTVVNGEIIILGVDKSTPASILPCPGVLMENPFQADSQTPPEQLMSYSSSLYNKSVKGTMNFNVLVPEVLEYPKKDETLFQDGIYYSTSNLATEISNLTKCSKELDTINTTATTTIPNSFIKRSIPPMASNATTQCSQILVTTDLVRNDSTLNISSNYNLEKQATTSETLCSNMQEPLVLSTEIASTQTEEKNFSSTTDLSSTEESTVSDRIVVSDEVAKTKGSSHILPATTERIVSSTSARTIPSGMLLHSRLLQLLQESSIIDEIASMGLFSSVMTESASEMVTESMSESKCGNVSSETDTEAGTQPMTGSGTESTTNSVMETVRELTTDSATVPMADSIKECVTRSDLEAIKECVTRSDLEAIKECQTVSVTEAINECQTLSVTESFKGCLNGSVKESIKECLNGSVKESIKECLNESVKESIKECLNESVKESIKECLNGSVKESFKECKNESVTESIRETVTGSMSKPVTGTLIESITESTMEVTSTAGKMSSTTTSPSSTEIEFSSVSESTTKEALTTEILATAAVTTSKATTQLKRLRIIWDSSDRQHTTKLQANLGVTLKPRKTVRFQSTVRVYAGFNRTLNPIEVKRLLKPARLVTPVEQFKGGDFAPLFKAIADSGLQINPNDKSKKYIPRKGNRSNKLMRSFSSRGEENQGKFSRKKYTFRKYN